MANPTQKQRVAALKAKTYNPPPKAPVKAASVKAAPVKNVRMAYTGFPAAPKPTAKKGVASSPRKIK